MVEDYRWGSFDRLVDIGGNSGHGLQKLLLRYPKPAGVCFDQPQARPIPDFLFMSSL